MAWQPALGSWLENEGCRFRVWAPEVRGLDVVLEKPVGGKPVHPLKKAEDGYFSGFIAGLAAGDHYRYRPDGKGPFPDPVSRFQPQGVHGPSEIIDSRAFPWTDSGWKGIALEDLIVYELHVGTFTAEGTFNGVVQQLPYLVELGVTAIELMPVADFPGQRNWGYDGVDLFAPARCYGLPDDLRRLVDTAHRLGLAVILDVVYNHFGPDGNYLGVYSPYYFSKRHHTAWGQALNFDGDHNRQVRDFFIENALYWIHEYHMDGLRLDATHAIRDDSPRPFLAELAAAVRPSQQSAVAVGSSSHQSAVCGTAAAADCHCLLIAEDHRNLARMVKPESEGGWGLDAVWADDFHHQARRLLAGDHESYYRDYTGSTTDLATTIRQGWFYCGQNSVHMNEPRGTDPSGIPPQRLVFCSQNHDQVGNRALGERLHHQIEPAAYRAASTLLLTCPESPMLFMGQEWAAGSPFLFFTDHHANLGRKVTEGRRREFRHFSAFADPHARDRIPDPQNPATVLASRLRWDEQAQQPHAAVLRLYRRLLQLRRNEPALRSPRGSFQVLARGEAIILSRKAAAGPALLVVVQLRGGRAVEIAGFEGPWEPILSTEDPAFSHDPCPPQLNLESQPPVIRFSRPGAIILREAGA
jgi:maltooligosyltrehalose trehalohydrolase